MTVAGIVPGAVLNAPAAGTSTFAVTAHTDGSGQVELSLDSRVSVITHTAFAASDTQLYAVGGAGNLGNFTMSADGAYTGQEKIVIRDDVLAGDAKLVITKSHLSGGTVGSATILLKDEANGAATKAPRLLHLIWTGQAWAHMNVHGLVASANALNNADKAVLLGVTGQ